jgi:hypothetical protein
LPSVTPLHSEPIYRHWNAAYTRPETFDVLYYYDGQSLTPAELRPSADGEHNFQVYLRKDSGETQLLGVIWEEDGEIGHFQLAAQGRG